MQPTTTSTARIAGAAGAVWTVANVIAGFSAGQPPAIDADGSTIRAYLLDHRTAAIAGAAVFAVTIPLLVTFFSSLIARLSAESDEGSAAAAIAAATGLAVGVGGLALAYLLLLPVVLDRSLAASVDDSVLQFLFASSFSVTMIGNIGIATTLLALAADARSAIGRLARRSAAAIGGLTVVLSAVGLANRDIAAVAGLAFVPVAVWVLAMSVPMVRDRGSAVGPVAAAAA